MYSALATVAFAALALAAPKPQGVSSAIAPSSTAAGCSPNYDGTFQIQVINVTSSKRDLEKRQSGGSLEITLQDGVLKDDEGRTGYVASNSQFQFDAPPQAGAIYTSGFSVCPNGTLAIGDDAVWYSCLSGTFYNLYDENVLSTGQCFPVYIDVIGAGGAAPAPTSEAPTSTAAPASTSAAPATSAPPTTSAAPTSAPSVTQISDGQIQAPTSVPVTQISDGQVQAPTGTGAGPASSYTGPAIATGAAPTNMPQVLGLAGAALAAVAMF